MAVNYVIFSHYSPTPSGHQSKDGESSYVQIRANEGDINNSDKFGNT